MNKTVHLNWLLIECIPPLSSVLSYSPHTTLFNKTFPSHWQTRNRYFSSGLNSTYISSADKKRPNTTHHFFIRLQGLPLRACCFPVVQALQTLLVVIITVITHRGIFQKSSLINHREFISNSGSNMCPMWITDDINEFLVKYWGDLREASSTSSARSWNL